MMKIVPALALLSAMVLPALGQYATLQVPKQIQYQGRVATGTGGAWAGTEGYFVFALVQGATVLWNNWQGTASPADPDDPLVQKGEGQVLTLPLNGGVFSIRLGDGSSTQQIPATVFFDTTANAVRTAVKLAVWFSPDHVTFTRLSPDVEFTAVPFAMVAGIAETVQDRSITTAKIADGTLVAADMSATLQADSLIPPGSVMPFAGTTPPAGWKLCDGSSHSRTDPVYERLNGVIGISHGGDASNFNLPDYRGRFMRGADAGSARDPERNNRDVMNFGGIPGNAVGSVQGYALENHGHRYETLGSNGFGVIGANSSLAGSIRLNVAENPIGSFYWTSSVPPSVNGANTSSETRPLNAYVNYIIKL